MYSCFLCCLIIKTFIFCLFYHSAREIMKPMFKTDGRNSCSFYKLMLSTNYQSKELCLPESFTRAFGDELSDTCHLTVPTGETHQVTLVGKNNELWFQDGWDEFVNLFSIGYGYFMLFTYHGNSTFGVNLFDLTACEISYNCDQAGTSSPMRNEPYHGFSDEFNDNDDDDTMSEDLNDMMAEDSNDTISESEEESRGIRLGIELPNWLKTYKKEIQAVTAAGISIPENPFFVVCIKPYSLTKSGNLIIPRGFHHHLKCAPGDCIKVEMRPRKQWVMRYCRTRLECRLGKGWVQFAQEACLDVGDVCLFELIDAEDSVFKVRVAKSS